MESNCNEHIIKKIDELSTDFKKSITIISQISRINSEQELRIFTLLEKHFNKADEEYKNIVSGINTIINGINNLSGYCSENFKGQLDVFKEFVHNAINEEKKYKAFENKLDEVITLLKK